jgi:hypothetical protein
LISFNNNSGSEDSENKDLIAVIIKTNVLSGNKEPKVNVTNKSSNSNFPDINKLYSQCLQKSLRDQILTLAFITLTLSTTFSTPFSTLSSAPPPIPALTAPFLSRLAREKKPTAKQVS